MDQTTLLYIMTAFVIISAVALLIQAGMLVGINKSVKALRDQITPLVPKVEALLPKVESLVTSTQATVEQSRRQIAEVTAKVSEIATKTNEILESSKRQLDMVEEVITDATSRAKTQMDHVELVLDDTLTRAHETVTTLHNGIMRPVRELSGIAVGIKTAVAYLNRNRRPSVDSVTNDEEMFI
jgi:methyl-accepting chemotaxis protein